MNDAIDFVETGLDEVNATTATDPLAILANLEAVVYDWDIPSDRLSWGPTVGLTLRGFPADLLATGDGFAGLVTADSEVSRRHALQSLLVGDDGFGASFRIVYRIASREGGILEVEDFGRWFAGPSGRPCRVHGVLRVLSRAPTPSPADPGEETAEGALCSRRSFNAWVDQKCAEARPTETAYALLIVGIANLAALNRAQGYDAADELIIAVGRRLAKSLRTGDKIVRYSGGKFALLISLAPGDQLDVAATRIARRANGEPFDTSAGLLQARVRVGAALAPRHGRNAHQLLQRAEDAFEQAETADLPVFLYSPDESAADLRRRESEIADQIVAALAERRIVLAFQPIQPTRSDLPPYEEALMRLRLADGGLLGPDSVIPVAEKRGLIEMLDERVLELTLACLVAEPARRLSMNVSVATLRAPDWCERLKARLAAAPGAAGRLTIELIETQAIDDLEATARILARMKALGVRIAMDDFGAGHTSFRNLRGLGVDIVKIDGAFVQNLARSADDRFFVRTLASLAQHLGIETVAEWVEDLESVTLLNEWGVDYVQGHAIGRARVPPEKPVRALTLGVG